MLLIQGGRLIDPKSGANCITDILLEGDRVSRIESGLPEGGCEIIDASGLAVAPGLVDTHVHFREPGYTHKEDILTGAAAAAAGGFTAVVCVANTNPVVDNPETLLANLTRGRETGIHVLQAASITVGMQGRELVNMKSLQRAGVAGFTDDGLALADAALVREAMVEAKKLGMPLSFHEEDSSLLAGSGINEGHISDGMGIPGACAAAEDVLVARDCMLALHTGARIVIQHISSANSVAMVRLARQLGADVWAEAAPHHFTLTEDAVPVYGTLAKMNPPLRTAADREAILEGLRDGTIGIIATDHAPHTADEKVRPFPEAPSGIIGLETSLALGITHLVRPGILTLPRLLAKMTANPAACYHLDAGSLYQGGPADLVLFDEREEWVVNGFRSKASNSPFLGCRLTGRVRYTICNGKIVYKL